MGGADFGEPIRKKINLIPRGKLSEGEHEDLHHHGLLSGPMISAL